MSNWRERDREVTVHSIQLSMNACSESQFHMFNIFLKIPRLLNEKNLNKNQMFMNKNLEFTVKLN